MNLGKSVQYQLSEALQSRGAVLAFSVDDSRFLWASENARELVRLLRYDSLEDVTMPDVLGPDITHAIRNSVTQAALTTGRARLGVFDLVGQLSEVWLCQAGDQLIIDVTEAVTNDTLPDPFDILHDVQLLSYHLTRTDDIAALEQCARVVRTLSGFHNVTACWLRDGKMDVVAQVGHSLFRPLRWPISARLHMIQDLSAPTVEVISLPGGPPPNVASSGLAAPKPTVLENLTNAGIAACTTIGFGPDDDPVGVFVLLHSAPRSPNRRTVLVLEHVSRLLTHRFT